MSRVAVSRLPRLRRRSASRSLQSAAVVGLLLSSGLGAVWPDGPGGTVMAAGSPLSGNELDRQRADVAVLSGGGPDGTPRLLVVDPVDPAAPTLHLAILERHGAWRLAATATLLPAMEADEGPGAPWLIGLGDDRFALLATSTTGERTSIVRLRVDQAASPPTIAEVGRSRLDSGIDDATVADVTGDGRPDLVVARARTLRRGGTCQGTEWWIYPDGDGSPTRIALGDVRLAAGVIGTFDAVPGDDLAAYAYPNCPAGPDSADELRLRVLRLRDGGTIVDQPAVDPGSAPVLPAPPVRLDADGDGRHELLALVPRGLAVIDPWDDWSDTRLATSSAIPLGAVPVGVVGGAASSTSVRVAWMEPSAGGRGKVGTEIVRRTPTGVLDTGPATVMWDADPPTVRWRLAVAAALEGALAQARPVAEPIVTGPVPCVDLFVPTAVIRCRGDRLEPGAAWIGTRPLLAVGGQDDRRLLVASGLGLAPGSSLPATAAPWATGGDGWWRHGPSAGFALAEVPIAATRGSGGGQAALVEQTATPTIAALVSAPAGSRVVATHTGLPRDAPAPDPTRLDAGSLFLERGSDLVGPGRIPVPPDSPSGMSPGSVHIDLDGYAPNGTRRDRWAVAVVTVDDRGEIGGPVAAAVDRDLVGPSLEVAVPFLSPVWPVPTVLEGMAEPGAVVRLPGASSVTVGEDGRFTVDVVLAPWLQTVRIVARDASGNVTVRDVEVIGGIDYRAVPWPAVLVAALLIGVVLTGVAGPRRPPREIRPTADPDLSSGPEVVDLPTQGIGPVPRD